MFGDHLQNAANLVDVVDASQRHAGTPFADFMFDLDAANVVPRSQTAAVGARNGGNVSSCRFRHPPASVVSISTEASWGERAASRRRELLDGIDPVQFRQAQRQSAFGAVDRDGAKCRRSEGAPA